jgi:hypothetical protein
VYAVTAGALLSYHIGAVADGHCETGLSLFDILCYTCGCALCPYCPRMAKLSMPSQARLKPIYASAKLTHQGISHLSGSSHLSSTLQPLYCLWPLMPQTSSVHVHALSSQIHQARSQLDRKSIGPCTACTPHATSGAIACRRPCLCRQLSVATPYVLGPYSTAPCTSKLLLMC